MTFEDESTSPSAAPLSTQELCAWLKAELDIDAQSADEIGDGNLNLVYRVRTSDGSVIVKQALPYLRLAGEGWPLTVDRARIEATALSLHNELSPGGVPNLIHFDADQHLIVMEDLRDHVIWRQTLIDGSLPAGMGAQVGEITARITLGTSDVLVPADNRKQLLKDFVNPELCAISEDLVFTSPYIDSPSNNIDDSSRELAERLRRDSELFAESKRLLWAFKTQGEALIHGDLHTGSVMVTDGDARVMDPEFAFYGPIGYDTGNVLAHLAFASTRHDLLGNQEQVKLITEEALTFWEVFVETIAELWPDSEPWQETFLARVLEDSASYAATEMIRRMVGMAQVADIESLELPQRYEAKQRIGRNARWLALGRPVRTVEELWDRAIHD
ncbi:S-methyl-5-thioribose kinase [Leucobacter sp. gxy201]|uniref:S-methyl-5-thioribose kinase n=1 Tax=Leucobacter sp. gxy201 TaxID=2957200 RepID=UPI003DA110E4